MRTLSSLLRRQVVTESGSKLGRCFDLRAELRPTSVTVTALVVGRAGFLEHFGIGAGARASATHARVRGHDTIPWDAVVRIEGKRIVVRDGAEPS